MKTVSLAIAIILSAAAASAAELTEADFEEFAENGVFDPDISAAEVNDMVALGISDDRPRIVELTVEAMGREAFDRAYYAASVARHFHLVPGMKEFLIGYWHANAADVTTGDPKGARLVPMILGVHYPGDEDAYNVIMELRAFGAPDYFVLMALNAGRFKTREADELRIASLSSDDFVAAGHAAVGIAMSRPSGGLEAVVAALRSNPITADIPATDIAIRAYGPEAVPVLRKSLNDGGLSREAESVISNGVRDIEDDRPASR